MIVISDTTPLISLLKINRIDLLEKLFGDVLIPQAVFEELTIDERFRLEADQIRQKKFIVVKPVNNPESANILKRATGLDQGESEAIVLTDELKADLLLMDEAKGRNVSTQMGLAITRSAILMHRGAIKVYSKEGEGTTFTVRIPLIYVN